MSLEINLHNLATRIATENKSLRTLINGNAADLSALTTTAKNTLVAAINELAGSIGEAGAVINDTTTSTTSVWSSSKTSTEISDSVTAAKAELLGGAGAAYDTLQELKDLLDASDAADDSAIAAINTALSNRLRFDAAQTLTAPQKVQVNANAGSLSLVQSGDPEADFVATFNAGLV